MTMNMGPSSTTSTMVMATSGAAGGHSSDGGGMDMDMGMDMGGGATCKISMLWNWYTVDACFISPTWQITSNGMFAASCIGVILLVVSLEFMRRISKEYDSFILRRFQQSVAAQAERNESSNTSNTTPIAGQIVTFRASPLQQLIRAVLHAITFGVAYIIMLLAMYYNGYIIICIFIGAGLGKFVCDWMILRLPAGTSSTPNKTDAVCDEPTVCCG